MSVALRISFKVTMEKSDVNLDLVVIEEAGELAIADAENPDDSTDNSEEEESDSSEEETDSSEEGSESSEEEESDSSEEESDSSEEESDEKNDKEGVLEKLENIHISDSLEKNESLESMKVVSCLERK